MFVPARVWPRRYTVYGRAGAYLRYDMRFSAPRLHNYGDA